MRTHGNPWEPMGTLVDHKTSTESLDHWGTCVRVSSEFRVTPLLSTASPFRIHSGAISGITEDNTTEPIPMD